MTIKLQFHQISIQFYQLIPSSILRNSQINSNNELKFRQCQLRHLIGKGYRFGNYIKCQVQSGEKTVRITIARNRKRPVKESPKRKFKLKTTTPKLS